MSDSGRHRSTVSDPAPEHSRRRFLAGLVALGAAGGAAVYSWLRLQSGGPAETVAGRTATVSSLQSSVVDDGQLIFEPTTESTTDARSDSVEEPADTSVSETTTGDTTTQPPAATLVDVPVICRQAWGAAEASSGLQAHTVQRLTVHHTASSISRVADGPGNIRGHQRFHQTNRGWPDIAYHFLVDPAGNIYQGRDPEFRGDTATNYDPSGHFLVCLEGDYDRAGVNDAQIASLALVLAWGTATFGVGVDTLAGHRDYADTQCPGDSVYSLLTTGSLAQRIEAVLAEGEPTLVDVCGAEGDSLIAEVEASTEQV